MSSSPALRRWHGAAPCACSCARAPQWEASRRACRRPRPGSCSHRHCGARHSVACSWRSPQCSPGGPAMPSSRFWAHARARGGGTPGTGGAGGARSWRRRGRRTPPTPSTSAGSCGALAVVPLARLPQPPAAVHRLTSCSRPPRSLAPSAWTSTRALRLNLLLLVGAGVYGVFGVLTFYLPELFPARLRATGAGFCYNFGRLFAAAGPLIVGSGHRYGGRLESRPDPDPVLGGAGTAHGRGARPACVLIETRGRALAG